MQMANLLRIPLLAQVVPRKKTDRVVKGREISERRNNKGHQPPYFNGKPQAMASYMASRKKGGKSTYLTILTFLVYQNT